MKLKNIIIGLLAFSSFGLKAQDKAWIEPSPTNVTDTVKIYVDLSKLNATPELQNVLDDLAAGLDLYMWTWSPFEHPAGSPKANGTGSEAWKSSNDILKMTKESETIYSYKMIPTEFYEVEASEVYQKGIKFLVKPKDGGGYGDPDRKSEDLEIIVKPLEIIRGLIYQFPTKITKDTDIAVFVYDAPNDVSGMASVGDNDCFLYMKATLDDSTTVQLANFANTANVPELQMVKEANGQFTLTMIPRDFFAIPENRKITKIEAKARKRVFANPATDQTSFTLKFDLGCE